MTFLIERGNDLETVTNSVICGVFLPNNSFLICKISTFYKKIWQVC